MAGSLDIIIQGVSKVTEQTTRVSSSHPNKEKSSYKHTSKADIQQ
jgi:hypothetical protein